MIPAAFEYHRPKDLQAALALMQQHEGDAKLMSGGMSLIPSMKLRMNQPQHLIDLGDVSELKGISVEGDFLRIGAYTTHWQVESSAVVRSVLPMLSEAAGVIADPQVRNRGTIGGSIANADPAADYPASALALEAELVCAGPGGERVVKATDWFQGLFTTALGEDEILREIRFPLPAPRTSAAYLKLLHPASRFALVGVAAVMTADESGICKSMRIGITGAGSFAVRATAVEQELTGHKLNADRIKAASQKADEGLEINGDIHFTEEDRTQLCRVYVERAVTLVMQKSEKKIFQR